MTTNCLSCIRCKNSIFLALKTWNLPLLNTFQLTKTISCSGNSIKYMAGASVFLQLGIKYKFIQLFPIEFYSIKNTMFSEFELSLFHVFSSVTNLTLVHVRGEVRGVCWNLRRGGGECWLRGNRVGYVWVPGFFFSSVFL